MKNINKLKAIFTAVLMISLFSSCLKKDLPAYPEWDGVNIDNVYIEHRFNGQTEYQGAPIVQFRRLNVVKTVEAETSTIKLAVTVPAPSGTFTAAEKAKVNQTNLIIFFDISTAATIVPLSGTPKPGELTNLTAPQKYEVTAANGSKKTWTVQVTSFTN